MIEYLQNFILTSAIGVLSFFMGACWMRENYIEKIRQLLSEIDRLTQYAKR